MSTGPASNPTSYVPWHGPSAEIYLQETHLSEARALPLVPATTETPIRSLLLGLGVWLGSSALLGPQSALLVLNAAAVGLLVCIAVLLRTGAGVMRTSLRVLGAWLFVTALLLPYGATFALWNNVIVALSLLAASLGKRLAYEPEPRSLLRP